MKQPSYSRIHKTHDFDDTRSLNDDSGSDPGESLVDHRRRGKTWDKDEGDYDQHLVAERPGQLCPWRRLCSSPWLQGILNLVLILVILGLLFERRGPATTTTASTTITTPVTTEFEGNGDLTGFIPPAGQQIKMFVPNMSFVPENGSEFFTREVQEMWLSLVPRMYFVDSREAEISSRAVGDKSILLTIGIAGLGYLNIKEPKKYDNLPHPLEGYGNKTVFTTSVTHQLRMLLFPFPSGLLER